MSFIFQDKDVRREEHSRDKLESKIFVEPGFEGLKSILGFRKDETRKEIPVSGSNRDEWPTHTNPLLSQIWIASLEGM